MGLLRKLVAAVTVVAGATMVAGVLSGCTDEAAVQRGALAAEADRALLAGDASAALQRARAAIHDYGTSPELALVAARACLDTDLKRYDEAVEYARKGAELLGDDDPDLAADLAWAEGRALMGRYLELRNLSDWRRANSVLEDATEAGTRRIEAAALLVGLQEMHPEGRESRQLKFARLVVQLAPDSQEAENVRATLAAKGVDL